LIKQTITGGYLLTFTPLTLERAPSHFFARAFQKIAFEWVGGGAKPWAIQNGHRAPSAIFLSAKFENDVLSLCSW